MNMTLPSIDVFQAGPARYALPTGTIERIEPKLSTKETFSSQEILFKKQESDEWIIFPRQDRMSKTCFALHVNKPQGRIVLITEKVLEVNFHPQVIIPITPRVDRFCGIAFISGLALWNGGDALVLRLDSLYAFMLNRRTHHAQR